MAIFKLILKDYESGNVFERGDDVIIFKYGILVVQGVITNILKEGLTLQLFGGKEVYIFLGNIDSIKKSKE